MGGAKPGTFQSLSCRNGTAYAHSVISRITHKTSSGLDNDGSGIGVLEFWSNGKLAETVSTTLHHSNTPLFPSYYRQCSFTQLTISIRLANQTSENDLAYLMASS